MQTTDVILLIALFVIVLLMLLIIARELNIMRRSQQEATAILRRLAESMHPGTTRDVPVTPEEDPNAVALPGAKSKAAETFVPRQCSAYRRAATRALPQVRQRTRRGVSRSFCSGASMEAVRERPHACPLKGLGLFHR